MHGTMASIWEFKSAKSANIENSRNINPVKIAYTVYRHTYVCELASIYM